MQRLRIRGRTGRGHGLAGRCREAQDNDGDVVPGLVRRFGPQNRVTDIVGRRGTAPLLETGPELLDRVRKCRAWPFYQAVGVKDQERAGRQKAFALGTGAFTGCPDDARAAISKLLDLTIG